MSIIPVQRYPCLTDSGALREEKATLKSINLRPEHPIGVTRLNASNKIVYGSIDKDGNLDTRTHGEQGHQTVPFAKVSLDGDIRVRMMDLDILGLGKKVGEKI